MILQLSLSYLAGIVAVISPCILPLIPVIFAGSMGNWKRGFVIVLGMILMFTLLGAITGIVPRGDYLDIAAYLGLILFGIILISDNLFVRYSSLTSRIVGKIKIPADGFLFGFLLGIIWSPCIGPIVGALLSYNAMSPGGFSGALSMFFFGLGIATAIGVILKFSEKRNSIAEFGEKIRKISGYIILIYVFLAVTGILTEIGLLLSRLIPV